MTYQTFISNILKSRPNVKQEGVYMERHHITPKSLGGSNDKSNLIYLTAREHFIAHKMLFRENHCPQTAFALLNMCNVTKGDRHVVSSREYEQLRKEASEHISGKNNPFYGKHISDEAKRKMSEANKGRKPTKEHIEKLKIINSHPFTEEHKRKMSEAQKGEKNHMYGKHLSEEAKKKLSKAKKGTHHTEEAKRKISEKHKGENNPFYGKHHTEEWRRKMGKKIINLDTNKVFYTMIEATEFYQIEKKIARKIGECCAGKRETAAGYHWAYYTEDNNTGENK